MTSPLLPYVNSYLLLQSTGVPVVVNGRIIASPTSKFILECYLARQDSSGTSTGGDHLPLQSSPGDSFPGVSGDVYLYRGYALRYAPVGSTYTLNDPIPPGLVWTQLVSTKKPAWLIPGATGQHQHGAEDPKYAVIERPTGRYGGTGVDAIISASIGGIPIIVRSGDLIN